MRHTSHHHHKHHAIIANANGLPVPSSASLRCHQSTSAVPIAQPFADRYGYGYKTRRKNIVENIIFFSVFQTLKYLIKCCVIY